MAEFRPAPIKPAADFSVFESLDIRVGTIRAVSDVDGSRKLLRFEVDLGDHTRRILAGMKGERDDPAELVGRQGLFLVNIPPRSMAGETSEGMFVDLGYSDGLTPCLAVPEHPVPDGTRLG